MGVAGLPDGPRMPTGRDDFMFDLTGFLVLKGAVDGDLLADLNAALDGFPDLEREEWWGNAQRHAGSEGEYRLQNCVEVGEPFERLIDHPSWIEYVRRYCSDAESGWAGLFIDECFASMRREGGYSYIHSGGYKDAVRTQYAYRNGRFRCGQVNIILALTDIGPDDGATMVVPGSHKSQFPYPEMQSDRMEDAEGAVPVYLSKGDALLFVDGLMHGSDTRRKPGSRRVMIYRYGPKWAATRYGYEYSEPLLERLTPERRKILQPVPPRRPPNPAQVATVA